MIVKANAKINLTLDITGVREDGYHDLSTVMQSLELADTLEIKEREDGEIKLYCDKEGIPTDSRNTVYKAAERLLKFADIKKGVDITIKKLIPSEAGMGGGSADAAAALAALKALFKIDISDEKLYKIATSVGADVPFCLHGGTCLCEGIGEKMTELGAMPTCTIVICKPPVGVSTGKAYSETDKNPQTVFGKTDKLCEILNSDEKNLIDLCEQISNRFDEVLQISEVQLIKKKMIESGALASCMTGSGSAVFGIYDEKADMSEITDSLKVLGEVFVTEPCGCVNFIESL